MAMVWLKNSAGVWTATGTGSDRTAVVSARTSTGLFTVQVECVDVAHEVEICVLSSQDARWCFSVGVDATDAFVRRVTAGRASGADGPPVDVYQPGAHGLATGVPFLLEARVVDQTISCYINGVAVVGAEYQNDVYQIYTGQKYVGFASAVPGAVVKSFRVCSLMPRRRPRTQALVALGGSEVWRSLNDEPGTRTISRISQAALDPDAEISATVDGQLVYATDGAKAIKIDPAAGTVELYIPTAGSLPGQIQNSIDKPGRTTSTVFLSHLTRLWAGGSPEDPQNAQASKQGDPENMDRTLADPGRAFVLAFERTGKVGAPIRGLYSDGDRLLVGADRSMHSILGDPVLDGAVLVDVTKEAGVNGLDSFCEAENGLVYAITPKGLMVIAGTTASRLSEAVLSALFGLGDAEVGGYHTILVRDPARQGVSIYLTRKATTAEPLPTSIHLWFDERSYRVTGGGFYPQRFPASMGPTAACLHNGREVLGTRDGYLVEYDNATYTDFDSTAEGQAAAIDTVCSIGALIPAALDGGPNERDVVVSRCCVWLGERSVPVTLEVFGGLTPQEAWGEGGARWALMPARVLSQRVNPIPNPMRASAIVFRLSSSSTSGTWSFESAEVTASGAAQVAKRARVLSNTFPAPCGPPSAPPGSGSGSGSGSGDFGSGPGSGGSGFAGSGSGSGPGSGTASGGSGWSGSGSASGEGSGAPIPGDSGTGVGGVPGVVEH